MFFFLCRVYFIIHRRYTFESLALDGFQCLRCTIRHTAECAVWMTTGKMRQRRRTTTQKEYEKNKEKTNEERTVRETSSVNEASVWWMRKIVCLQEGTTTKQKTTRKCELLAVLSTHFLCVYALDEFLVGYSSSPCVVSLPCFFNIKSINFSLN